MFFQTFLYQNLEIQTDIELAEFFKSIFYNCKYTIWYQIETMRYEDFLT